MINTSWSSHTKKHDFNFRCIHENCSFERNQTTKHIWAIVLLWLVNLSWENHIYFWLVFKCVLIPTVFGTCDIEVLVVWVFVYWDWNIGFVWASFFFFLSSLQSAVRLICFCLSLFFVCLFILLGLVYMFEIQINYYNLQTNR